MIVKADKGRTSMIIYTEDYNKKVNDFLKENNFQIISKDPKEKYNKLITKAVQQSDTIINKTKGNSSSKRNHNHQI